MQVNFFVCSSKGKKVSDGAFYMCLNWPTDLPSRDCTITFEARNGEPASGSGNELITIEGRALYAEAEERMCDVLVDVGSFAEDLQSGRICVNRWLTICRPR